MASERPSPIQPPRDAQQSAGALLTIVHAVLRELHPHRADGLAPSLDSRLERELGLDSLGRVELLLRVEREFGVGLPDHILASAETPRDLLRAIAAARPERHVLTERAVQELALEAVETLPERAETLVEMLDWHVRTHPARPHVVLYGEDEAHETITYGELQARAEAMAAGLQARGLQPAETVAIMLPTCAEYLYCFFGVLIAGGVPVPIYPPVRASQVEDHLHRHAGILNNAQVRALITVTEAKPVAMLLRARVPSLAAVNTPRELMSDRAALVRPALKGTDLAFLQYTSGSTGSPKGVMLTHANLLANVRAMGRAARVDSTDVFVSWLPLYHDMGLIGAWFGSMYHAFLLVLMSPLAFLARPERWLWAIHRHGGTISGAPNFAYELCLRRIPDARLQGLDLSSFRFTVNGAEPVSPETLKGFQERFAGYGLRPGSVAPVYGLAECSVGLAFSPPGRSVLIDRVNRGTLMRDGVAEPVGVDDSMALHLVACGQALPGHEIRIVDETGREAPDRHEGVLQFRGPSTTSGYYRNSEDTRKLFDGDWLNSGDLAYTVDGDIYITGRVKDVIIRAGRNLYPYELEQAVGDLEGIRRGCIAVFGVPDSASGTERMIVLAETREREPDARAKLRERIEQISIDLLGAPPEEVVLAPPHTVLKTSSGKIRRGACRALYEGGEIGKRRSVWWQLARVALASVVPQARRWLRATGARAYAAWWWALLGLLAPPVWLAVALAPWRPWAWRVVRLAARALLRLTGIPVTLRGAEHFPRGKPCLYVVNHQSYLDGLVLCATLPERIVFVAKRELAGQWIAGRFLRALGAEFVERFDKQRGLLDARRLTILAAAGHPLVFFPEGTFTRVPGLRPFHMGAFQAAAEANLPVVPVVLRGTRAVLRDGNWFPRRGRISVAARPPIVPDGTDWAAAIRLRDLTRHEMLRHCGEPDLAPAADTAPSWADPA